MKVEQIATLCNTISGEVLGKTEVVQNDLSNVVDFGNEIIGTNNLDNYVKSLIDHIGKMAFVDRPYSGSAPSVLMDGWEFGSILEKVTMSKLPEAQENSSWKLVNGQSYDTGVFTAPEVSAKFYNSLATYEIPMSFAEKQVKSAFSSAQQMNAFFSMIQTAIETSMTVKTDGLVMDTINSMTAETLYNYNAEDTYTGIGNNRAVNLLALYNARFGTTLAPEKCLTDAQFIRWSSFMIGLYSGRMTKLSTLFNIGGQERFTARISYILLCSTSSLRRLMFTYSQILSTSSTQHFLMLKLFLIGRVQVLAMTLLALLLSMLSMVLMKFQLTVSLLLCSTVKHLVYLISIRELHHSTMLVASSITTGTSSTLATSMISMRTSLYST